MSEENAQEEKKRPAIKGYGYTEAGNKESRFELALWVNENGKGFSGEFKGDRVVAFRDSVKADGEAASPNAPTKLYTIPADKEEKIDWKAPLIELFPMNNDKRATIGNAEKGVFVTVTEGNSLVGVPEAPVAEAEADGPGA